MKYIFIFLIKIYQKITSPFKTQGVCRFNPTCSSYAIEAYSRFGVIRGTILSIYRIIRCNPWNKGGYDPVPEKFSLRRKKNSNMEE